MSAMAAGLKAIDLDKTTSLADALDGGPNEAVCTFIGKSYDKGKLTDDVFGDERMGPILRARFSAAYQEDLFAIRTSFLSDLKMESDSGVFDNNYTLAYNLLTVHSFDYTDLLKLESHFSQYAVGSGDIDEIMYTLRDIACRDLQQYIKASCQLLREPPDAETSRRCVKNMIRWVGKGIVKDNPKGPYYEYDYNFDKEYSIALEKFRRVTGYTNDCQKRAAKAWTGKYNKNAMKNTLLFSTRQASLETRMNDVNKRLDNLATKIEELNFAGKLNEADRIVFSRTIGLIDGRKGIYFPIIELRKNSENKTPEPLRVGNIVDNMIADSSSIVAYSWGESSIAIIYVLKLVRFLLQMGALWVSVKIFNDSYVKSVYAGKTDPPPIQNLLYLFIGMDLTIQLSIVTMVVLLASPGRSMASWINDQFMSQLLIDELATSGMVTFLGSIVASFVWRKRYFMYKTDGLGAIKCFADIMVGICAIMVIVPFFLLV